MISQYVISESTDLDVILYKLNLTAPNGVLFVVNAKKELIGSISDGDVRRGMISSYGDSIKESKTFINRNPKYLSIDIPNFHEFLEYRNLGIKLIPCVDKDKKIIDIIDLTKTKSFLPVDAVIMAGGLGSRLRPLTNEIPKPLLKVGSKAIVDYSYDRLKDFGVKNFHVTLNYLGNQIKDHFLQKNQNEINFVFETKRMGTIGSLSLIDNIKNPYVLLTNSDILTNIDYEKLFLKILETNADMVIGVVPHKIKVPYGVIESINGRVTNLKEKPTYIYNSNSGIYIIKSEALERIPKDSFYNATDLALDLIKDSKKVMQYNITEYWLDIGKHEDFEQAQLDVKSLSI